MAKPKGSSGGSRNDSRANGKANKQNPGRKVKGSRKAHLDEGTKVLLGGGMLVRYEQQDSVARRRAARDKSKGKVSED